MDGMQAAAQMQQSADPAQQQPTAPASAPQPTNVIPSSTIQPVATPQYQAPTQPQRRGGFVGILDTIADMLSSRDTQQVSIDPNTGQRQVTPGPQRTRGQQVGRIIGTALEGAARGAAAPPGPDHVGQGFANGTLGAIQDQQRQQDKADKTAQEEYQRQRQAKIDGLNYQLGIRNIAHMDLTLKAMGVKATNDAVTFSQAQEDRERKLDSFDLGVVGNAGQIADVMSKLPNWEQELYQREGIQAVPVYGQDGTRNGLRLFLRKQDTGNQAAAEGTKVPRLVPGKNPGDAPHTEYFTPVGAKNRDIDTYMRAYTADVQKFQKDQADNAAKKAEANKANADASEAPSKIALNNAEAAKNYADAEKLRADAQKAKNDPNDPTIQALGEQIAKGGLTEDQVPGFARIKPAVQAYLAEHHPNLDQKSVFLTGEERKRVDLAGNALHNLDTIQQAIQKRPDLIGLMQGRISSGKELFGTNDKDLTTIATALDNYALASTGAHGIRAVQARADAKAALLNSLKNGPQGIASSIETARGSLKNLALAGKPRGIDGSMYVYNGQQSGQQQPAQGGTFVTPSFTGQPAPGMVRPGNIDLSNRPNIKNPDGSTSTVFSMGVNVDGKEMLIPGVGDGSTYPLRKLTPKEAVDQFRKTGKNLGTFADAKSSDAYAQTLHLDQARGNQAATPKPAPPQGMVQPIYFKASDGNFHWVPQANLAAARQIDPKLQVIP